MSAKKIYFYFFQELFFLAKILLLAHRPPPLPSSHTVHNTPPTSAVKLGRNTLREAPETRTSSYEVVAAGVCPCLNQLPRSSVLGVGTFLCPIQRLSEQEVK